MKRRDILCSALFHAAGVAALLGTAGCMAPRIGEAAADPTNGSPWRCSKCGHLTRSPDDLTEVRCPRCRSKKYERISENAMKEALEQ